MPEKRWLLGLGPPIGALGALGALALFASVSAGGAAGRWAPPPCGPGMTLQAAAAETPTERADGGETWYRLDPSLDDKGELAGQRLTIGRRGGRSRLLDLPPESFVAGPFGGVVLVGSDDGQLSRLAAIDVPAGCSWSLDRQTSVVQPSRPIGRPSMNSGLIGRPGPTWVCGDSPFQVVPRRGRWSPFQRTRASVRRSPPNCRGPWMVPVWSLSPAARVPAGRGCSSQRPRESS
jgi:hypothetical protein